MSDDESKEMGDADEKIHSIYEKLNARRKHHKKKSDSNSDSDSDDDSNELANKFTADLEKAKNECNTMKDMLRRNIAEFDNYRRRAEAQKEELRIQIVSDVVLGFLSVLDIMYRALASMQEEEEQEENAYYKGYVMIVNQFEKKLEDLGITSMDVKCGDDFDSSIHDAIAHVEDESLEKNVIKAVVEKGYMYKNKVIRFCKVIVAN